MKGKVYIVGSGPGDAGLLTLRALELMKSADIILYDRLVSDEILKMIPASVQKTYVGRSVGDDYSHQDETNTLMLRHARDGKKVVRLKGGDPFIFGRGGEEAEFLQENGIEFEIVPGISSATASPAYAGIPLTHRLFSSSVAIVTGHEDAKKGEPVVNWKYLARAVDTIVILMGMGRLEQITSELASAGMSKDTPVAIIESGTTAGQRTVLATLGDIVTKSKETGIKPPAVIVIGRAASLAPKLGWFAAGGSLKGRTVAITRDEENAREFVQMIESRGGRAVALPTISLVPRDSSAVMGFLEKLKQKKYDYILFMSASAVRIIFDALAGHGKDALALMRSTSMVAVGPHTKQALEGLGLKVALMPARYSSYGITELFSAENCRGKSVLVPRSSASTNYLAKSLTDLGMAVEEIHIYDVKPAQHEGWAEFLQRLCTREIDCIVFTSASSVHSFFEVAAQIMDGRQLLASLNSIKVIAIGPFTNDALVEHGINAILSEEHTVEGTFNVALNILGK